MSKLATLGIILVLLVGGLLGALALAGKQHVGVVINNTITQEENQHLKSENQLLKEENRHLRIESKATLDTLSDKLEKRDSVIDDTNKKLESIEKSLENEKVNSITNSYNTTPYIFEPIELPSSEDNQ